MKLAVRGADDRVLFYVSLNRKPTAIGPREWGTGFINPRLYRVKHRSGEITWVLAGESLWENPQKPGAPIGWTAMEITPKEAYHILKEWTRLKGPFYAPEPEQFPELRALGQEATLK